MGNLIDAFLNSGARGSGDYLKMLKNWRKRPTPEIYTWMHTRTPPQPVWRHSFPRVKVWNDRDTKETHRAIFTDQFVSHESPRVMNAQYFRDRETDVRNTPPERCPFSFLLEYVRALVMENEMHWLTPLFHFEVQNTDPKTGEVFTTSRTIHAGGFVGMFNDRLSEDEKLELKRAGIQLNDSKNKMESAWAQSALAKQSYVFPIVDNADPDAGMQVTVESKLVYQKVCDVILKYRNEFTDPQTKQVKSEIYDPFTHPYCIQWTYHPNAQGGFNNTYNASKIPAIALTPKIEELIYSDPPDLSSLTSPAEPRLLRSIFESSCQVKGIPWDDIFRFSNTPADAQQLPAGPAKAPELPYQIATPPAAVALSAEDDDVCPECGPNKDCPHVACAKCDMPIFETDPVCKHCKHVYQIVPAVPPPPRPTTDPEVGPDGLPVIPF